MYASDKLSMDELLFLSVLSASCPGARFSKAPETVQACKATFSSSASKNGAVYTPETSCMKGTYVHIKKMSKKKRLCYSKVRDFALAFRARKV